VKIAGLRFFACGFVSLAATVARAAIVETYAMSPRNVVSPDIEKVFLKPDRNWVSFGGLTEGQSTGLFLGRYGVSTIPLLGTVLENTINVASHPLCGPSPKTNTMACYNSVTGEFLQEFPTPGNVTTQPVFFDGSWFFGTSKGFFVRTEGTSLLSTPLLGSENIGYWGTPARKILKALKPLNSLDAPEKETDPRVTFRKQPRAGWRWYATTSSEFMGSPLLVGSQILVLTAQQFLLSLDSGTGKTLWSVRLAPETALRLDGRALMATAKEVLVGTDDGQLLAVNPKDGAILWRHLLATTGRERFRSVVAAPSAMGRSVFVSNAESVTLRLALDSRAVEWSYPIGSVARTQWINDALIVAGSDGNLVSLDAKSGALKWKVALSPDTSLTSIGRGKQSDSFLVADKKGRVFQVRAQDGKVLDSTGPVGEVVGEFFQSYNDQCLSFADNGFRCFSFSDAKPLPLSIFAAK
jgi:outer membrane protein assembly factor BamB